MKRLRSFLRSWDGPILAALLLAVAVVLAFAPDAFLTMLARAFLVQWAMAFAVLAVLCVWARAWWTTGAAVLAAGLVLYPPMASGATVPATAADALKVAQLNVFQPNADHAEVVVAALGSGADVLSFQEVSPAWATVLEQRLAAAYPYHVAEPLNNCYGIALYSREPLKDARVLHLAGNPVVDVSLDTPQGPVRVIAVHAASPGSYPDFKRRNVQLEGLAQLVSASTVPTVVVGDLNTVSWDQAMQRLCARSGLREEEHTSTATWPSALGTALIPLDHVLVSPALGVSALRSFVIPGSDHRGLVAQLAFTR